MAGRRRIGAVSAAAALTAGLVVAAGARPCVGGQEQQERIITLHSGGLDGLLVSPKDAGLKNALRMVNERIEELPEEIDDPSMPAPVISFVLDLLGRPLSIRGALLPGIEEMDLDAMDAPPFSAQVDFYTSTSDEAGELSQQLAELMRMASPEPPAPDPDHPGINLIDADGAPLRFGPGQIGEEDALSIAVNGYSTEVNRINLTGFVPGVQPAFAMELNLAPLTPLMEKAIEEAPPDQRPMLELQMQMYGWSGDHPLRVIAAAGHAADRSHGMMRIVNGRVIAEAQDALADGALTAGDLRLIPADATYAEAGKFDPAYLTGMLDMMRQHAPPEMEGQDPVAMFEQMTGINLQTDIIDHLGDTYWTYTADGTGGGLTGYVSIVELSDAAGMQASLDNLTQMANQMAQGPARGYVRFMSREVGGHQMTVLTFPGLPIPLEISCAIVGDRLYSGLSPQSLLSAVAQASNPAGSILDNPRFQEMGGGAAAGAIQVAFVDTPRLARSGYGLVSMGMAALANAVRSPRDPARDPGLIMPSVTELLNGAKATVYVTRVEGDDIVVQSQGDRSALVNLCGVAGAMGGATGAAAAAAIGAGVVLPAIGQARAEARNMMGLAQLRSFAMAVHVFAADNDDRLPESIDQLIDLNYIASDLVDSPMGDMVDGFDYGFQPAGRLSAVESPDLRILAWDRVTLTRLDTVNVVFVDGHVQQLSRLELQELLAHPANQGLDLLQ